MLENMAMNFYGLSSYPDFFALAFILVITGGQYLKFIAYIYLQAVLNSQN
jgi:hypothetical protein